MSKKERMKQLASLVARFFSVEIGRYFAMSPSSISLAYRLRKMDGNKGFRCK